jgi:flagellar hook protein FlgE
MLRSLFSGITGLRAHQTMMDVVANNIANVNTIGYKSSNAVFKDTLSQMLKGAGAPQSGIGIGGTNPAQIGLGVQLAAVTTNFTQGAAQMTGRSSDLMIQGDGFFAVKSAGEQLFTRAGSLGLDADGRMVTPDGGILQGWMGTNGKIDNNTSTGDIKLPIGTLLKPVGTTAVALGGNLPAGAAVGTTFNQKILTYDPQGNAHTSAYTYLKTAANTWTLNASEVNPPPAAATALGTEVTLTFDPAKGILTGVAGGATPLQPTYDASDNLTGGGTVGLPAYAGGPAASVNLTKISQFGGTNTAVILSQDGSGMGTLQSYAISPDGTIVGVFSNGLKQQLAQLALGTFNNPGGLEKVGNTMFRSTVNSGNEQIGTAGSGGRGLLAGGMTEMSNVDLAAEFTNLIISQRGFQANSRVITASDELLQDLVQMKR